MMSDRFTPTPLPKLLKLLLNQIDNSGSVLGIEKELFFRPSKSDKFRFNRFDRLLETPIGVAAGPHTQLSQNIIAAWLTGARYIELKTVQTLDELDVSKPCIDMQDEGYNCEWSQELKIHESADQYLDALILIHILKDKLGIGSPNELGVIFNMSVGYDLAGIMKENVQYFFDKMDDSTSELKAKIEEIIDIYPNVVNLEINPQISDNITLSTMHGCPPDEIEQIGEYLITKRKLHTTIKLNPTLLGKEELREIINNSGFNTDVPDEAFEHDVKYPDAVAFIKRLTEKAKENNVFFGLKLTNTLESVNNKSVFPEKEPMMYASGKVLHPISINVARKLQNEFAGNLDISFSGGADAFNIVNIVECGLYPVTVSSDLLKPGGYGRLAQYIENLRKENEVLTKQDRLTFLNIYAEKVKTNPLYKKETLTDPSIKTTRPLGTFDCSYAPCEDTCPTNQGIPSYMYYTAGGDFEKAYEVITKTNPFPNSTGMVCDHTCQSKCTRINYDSPLLIREIKRFVSDVAMKNTNPEACVADDFRTKSINIKAAVIGAGPAGLSAAYFLAKAGFEVNVYETKPKAGGMVSGAIPKFRLTDEGIDVDIRNIEDAGVKIHYSHKIDSKRFEELQKENKYVYIGAGAQKSKKLNIEGIETKGSLDPLDFLFKVKQNQPTEIGKNVVIIGGGNTAMDVARTAYRLVGKDGKVTIVYRRTIQEMPAEYHEIKDVMDEGVEILELNSPEKVNSTDGKIVSLTCSKMKLGDKDESGRRRPVKIENSEFDINIDTIIPAIGQDLDLDFASSEDLQIANGKYETKIKNVFIGGDAMRGASTFINAVGDGRKAAQEIINKSNIDFETRPNTLKERKPKATKDLMLKKAKRIEGVKLTTTELNDRHNFNLVNSILTKEEAMEEAMRCLLCDDVCNICTTLCPNLALQHYEIEPVKYNLKKVKNGKLVDDEVFEVEQKEQIIHLADWCNQCANCETFCPSSGAPYKEKPHLYFNKKQWEIDQDGYYFDSETKTLLKKEAGFDFSLTDKGTYYEYQDDCAIAKLDKATLAPTDITGTEDIKFKRAAEMTVIFKVAETMSN